MDSRFAHLTIVGWYHTHPDFGVFLSDRDRFIHEHFFAHPGQIAHVIDPIRKTEGVFVWREGKTVLDAPLLGRRPDPRRSRGTVRPARAASVLDPRPRGRDGASARFVPAASREDARLPRGLLGGLSPRGSLGRLATPGLGRGAVAHYGIWKGLRPGLRERSSMALDSELVAVAAAPKPTRTHRTRPRSPGES